MTILYKINYILTLGPVSPKNLLGVLEDTGSDRKESQIEFQKGLEKGLWHLDTNMHVKLGSFPY